MSETVLPQISQLVADLFDIPVQQITPSTGPSEIPAWDSVQHLNLLLELEQTYGVRIDLDDMGEMQSVGAIATMVESKIAQASS